MKESKKLELVHFNECIEKEIDGKKLSVYTPGISEEVTLGLDHFQFKISDDFATKRAYLLMTYIDTGYSEVSVSYDKIGDYDDFNFNYDPARVVVSGKNRYDKRFKAGYCCANTQKIRHAVFILEDVSTLHRQDGCDISVTGLDYLLEYDIVSEITDEWDIAKSEIPTSQEVEVSLKLKKEIELISTAASVPFDAADFDDCFEYNREKIPSIKALGFNALEYYIRWNLVEFEEGIFDWSYYDRLVDQSMEYGLQIFPLLIVGSAYALPKWYYTRKDFKGYICLEHELENDIPTIFDGMQDEHVIRFLNEFGKHYSVEKKGCLMGVRLGPTGVYGESQYPATGKMWGHNFEEQHTHVGWWAADEYATVSFRAYLKEKYKSIEVINEAWSDQFKHETYTTFEDIDTFLPSSTHILRKRKDFVDWYVTSMTIWCEKWAIWAREAMPETEIYQCEGGWAFPESGTDFYEQTRSMAKVNGGARTTNEAESYVFNFLLTQPAATAARFYKTKFGTEPAGFGTMRGVLNRLYNVVVNNGDHLFYYCSNITTSNKTADKFIHYAKMLDDREAPYSDVAMYYPTTMLRLDDSTLKSIYGSSLISAVSAMRGHMHFDMCSETMIEDGALDADKYKVLFFVSRHREVDCIEAESLNRIDAWVRDGGCVIYPFVHGMTLQTVEGDVSVLRRWRNGDTGKGQVIFKLIDREPINLATDYIYAQLQTLDFLDQRTKNMLDVECEDYVYTTVLESGKLAIHNFRESETCVKLNSGKEVTIESFGIAIVEP